MNFPQFIPFSTNPIPTNGPHLPSFEEATGNFDVGRLPSYKISRRHRFHPYRRPSTAVIDPVEKYFNTIFDDEYVPLEVPARILPPLPVAALVPGHLLYNNRRAAVAYQLHVERLAAFVMNEFVAGLHRARRQG